MRLDLDDYSIDSFFSRIVALPQSRNPFDGEVHRHAFTDLFRALCEGHPIPATPDGVIMHEALEQPQLVLLDVSFILFW